MAITKVYSPSAGATGPAGPTGPTGATGPTGPAGAAGLTWQGTWASTTAYVVNDAVSYSGSSYRRLVTGTTSTTPDVDTTNWAVLAAQGAQGAQGNTGAFGVTWKGTWGAAVAYAVRDAVLYSGTSYRRTVAGTTSTTPDQDSTNWTVMALGVNWRGTWASATAYALGDAVYYAGTSYRRLVAGTTSTTPDLDATNWQMLAQGLRLGTWTNITLSSGWSAYTSLGHSVPQWRREGDIIRLRGAFGKGGSTWTANGAPLTYDPAWGPIPVSSQTVTLSGGSTVMGRLSIWGSSSASSGIWELAVSGSTAWMPLDGVQLYWPAS